MNSLLLFYEQKFGKKMSVLKVSGKQNNIYSKNIIII